MGQDRRNKSSPERIEGQLTLPMEESLCDLDFNDYLFEEDDLYLKQGRWSDEGYLGQDKTDVKKV